MTSTDLAILGIPPGSGGGGNGGSGLGITPGIGSLGWGGGVGGGFLGGFGAGLYYDANRISDCPTTEYNRTGVCVSNPLECRSRGGRVVGQCYTNPLQSVP